MLVAVLVAACASSRGQGTAAAVAANDRPLSSAGGAAGAQGARTDGSLHPTTRSFSDTESWSEYITMRDGVRLAVDVHLPEPLAPGERTATILHMSRYFRSVSFRAAFKTIVGFGPYAWTERDVRQAVVKAGYSWVDVDVRGSGASFGTRDYPLSPDEVRDGADLIDWIIAQPWSAGVVGATGTSYDGTLAETLLRNRHPALKAIAPRFSGWDVYADIFQPGGINASGLLRQWSELTTALDRNRAGDYFGWRATLMIRGVQPVTDDLLKEAVAEHAQNVDVEELLGEAVYRDDTDPRGANVKMFSLSPHKLAEGDASSDVAIYGYTGWWDGAHPRSQARQYLSYSNPGNRLLLGPWFHGGLFNASRYAGGRSDDFDHAAEMLRFFDYHLRGIDDGFTTSQPVRYYTMGEERWKLAETWPPPGGEWRSYFFAPDNQLSLEASAVGAAGDADRAAGPGSTSYDTYEVDESVNTGTGSRWGLIVGTGDKREYKDRREIDRRLLTYTSPPLETAIEVTGHPIVRLYLSANASDGAVFVYLEDVHPDGEVTYVTEGQLRAIHRQLATSPIDNDPVPFHTFLRADARPLVPGEVAELVFDLLPTSFLFQEGHSIRVAIAGVDAGQFAAPLPVSPLMYAVHRDLIHRSRIELPTHAAAPRAATR
jgi:putative CocE/NonD family hydrolase